MTEQSLKDITDEPISARQLERIKPILPTLEQIHQRTLAAKAVTVITQIYYEIEEALPADENFSKVIQSCDEFASELLAYSYNFLKVHGGNPCDIDQVGKFLTDTYEASAKDVPPVVLYINKFFSPEEQRRTVGLFEYARAHNNGLKLETDEDKETFEAVKLMLNGFMVANGQLVEIMQSTLQRFINEHPTVIKLRQQVLEDQLKARQEKQGDA